MHSLYKVMEDRVTDVLSDNMKDGADSEDVNRRFVALGHDIHKTETLVACAIATGSFPGHPSQS